MRGEIWHPGILWFLSIVSSWSFAGTDPCGDSYGGAAHRRAIEEAMVFGTAADVVAAINAAKEARGPCVGTPENEVTYVAGNDDEPEFSEIMSAWRSVHLPEIQNYHIDCPRPGRMWAAAALGAYAAHQAGEELPAVSLRQIALMMEAQQYGEFTAPEPLTQTPGVFAVTRVAPDHACYIRGVIGEATNAICQDFPHLCVTYEDGLFAGWEFVVADTDVDHWFLDGGMAYDQGWAGAMMIEAWLQATRPEDKSRWEASARAAGEWAVAEPCVRNHNYTGKLIWLLAQLYGLTGEDRFKKGLWDKLQRNLLPGVLMDQNQDGLVDGMTFQPFSELHLVAQRPGRMWDGHNALPWYHAMNAFALAEAYVAFRDRGDVEEAAVLRPYVMAMFDNAAWEINHLGPCSASRPIPYAFSIALWKIAAYENDPHPQWDRAAWAVWNLGYGDLFGDGTVNTGTMLLVQSGVPYQPLSRRNTLQENMIQAVIPHFTLIDNLWQTSISLFNPNANPADVMIAPQDGDGNEYPCIIRRMEPKTSIHGDLQELFPVALPETGWLQLGSEHQISGVLTFTFRPTDATSSLPLDFPTGRQLVFPLMQEDQAWSSGLVLTNIAETLADVALEFRNFSGEVIGFTELTVPAKAKRVAMCADLLEMPLPAKYFLRVEGSQTLAGFSLMFTDGVSQIVAVPAHVTDE